MRLFSNRSQKTSKCGKNSRTHSAIASSATFLFLPHFDVICDLLLNRRTATWNLFVNYQMANDFGKFFAQKIADIRSAITNQICLPVTINATSSVAASCFSEFDLLSESEVFDLITASSKKSCPLDPIPIKLLTEYVDVPLPPITKIISLTLDSGHFPRTWRCALVRPLLKKDGLPPVFKNFRPVSNLAFISKLVETVVAKQLRHYLNCNNLFPMFQSAYRQNHSTETALIKVMNDILLNMSNQRVTLLILLDLSAAFDTVDNDTMLRRLEYSFGLQGKALSWFASICLAGLSG